MWSTPSACCTLFTLRNVYATLDSLGSITQPGLQPGCKCLQEYPNMLVTAGLHDPRVAYWEPAKWVAKLRLHKTDSNMLLFKCDMGAGHFSQSGRFDALKELAIDYAFILLCQDKLKTAPVQGAA